MAGVKKRLQIFWTEEEEAIMVKWYSELGAEDIAQYLPEHYPLSVIKNKAMRMRIAVTPWTKKRILARAQLRKYGKDVSHLCMRMEDIKNPQQLNIVEELGAEKVVVPVREPHDMPKEARTFLTMPALIPRVSHEQPWGDR